MVIWLIGLSSVGKTTIGEILQSRLKEKINNVIFLDGDNLREVWGADLDHSIEGRRANAERISKLCRLLEKQDFVVVTSILSIFPEWRAWNRKEFRHYFEVYLKADLSILEDRDGKKIYRQARNGEIDNVVGIDIPFPEPTSPDATFDTGGIDGSAEEIADKILSYLPTFDD